MFYPDDVVENVRMHNNIVDVISGYVSLAKKGKYMFGLCPFHSEKTPSFSVDPERQMFYCYSCNKGGDVFKFVMDIENIDFSDSVKKLALTARIELPESTDRKAAERNRARARLIELNTIAARFFHDSLVSAKGTVGIEYLRNRKINSGTIKKFGLGYAPGGWDALYGFLKGKGFTDDELSKGGLALKNKNGDYYDRFRERVIFPIIDVTGNVIGFGGRVIDDSLPKYVNSPETLAFSKRKNLFGLNFAKKSKTKQIVLVEGYLDVITLHEHGIDNAVAALGTALTKSHGDLLKHYTNDIVIAFDTDAAGKAAAMKSIDILDRTGANITVLSIPEGKDPDEFINDRGAEGFRRLISSAKPVVEYKISAIRDQISDDSVNGRIKFLESVTTVLMEIDGEIEREMYVKDISRQYGVSEQAITSEIARRLERRNRSGGEGFGGGALTGALTGAVAGAGVGWRLGTGMRAGGGRDLGGNLRVSAGRGLGGNVRVGAGGNSGGGIRAGAGGNSDGGIRAGASGDLGGGKDADSSDGGR
ncbi:MAG: DNA primase, partial [Oscillospiraceae bacterium]|nr:DNA primase [Oscillospiraceae bacterium]